MWMVGGFGQHEDNTGESGHGRSYMGQKALGLCVVGGWARGRSGVKYKVTVFEGE